MQTWLIIVIAIFTISAVNIAVDLIKKTARAIAAAPGKGFKKIINVFKDRKLNKAEKAYRKALLEASDSERMEAMEVYPDLERKYPEVALAKSKLNLANAKYKK